RGERLYAASGVLRPQSGADGVGAHLARLETAPERIEDSMTISGRDRVGHRETALLASALRLGRGIGEPGLEGGGVVLAAVHAVLDLDAPRCPVLRLRVVRARKAQDARGLGGCEITTKRTSELA